MKHKVLLLVAMLVAAAGMFAQSANNEDEVVKIDRMNQNAYREGEILVKFKADGAVQMRAPRKAKFQTSQVNAVDALFEELGVDSVEQLMPMTGHKNVGRRVKAYNGKDVEVKDLSKLYRLTLKAEKAQTMFEAIDKLKAQEEVEFAEPNYIVYTMALPYNDSIPTADQQTYTSEPLYSQQWGLQAINLPALWDKPKRTNKRPVIAILDTGVDIEHPDLAANIWTNIYEANGIANQDDDANGFKDDIHGWDFINNHSVTNDFNGHGTHCAGIAAAVGNNGIGITGANPDALIMPVTVMQSNGTGDVATIVKGIDYAAANGADVISMSIGSYGYSIAEEQALGRAYAKAILVAAAGNDGLPINRAPMFPAAFSYVLGVEASSDAQGEIASYSNNDIDGPLFSTFDETSLYNYELRAPGTNILSTFSGGRYKILNGTSMACPLVAGAISRLIQCKEIVLQELLFGDLIHTRQGPQKIGNVDVSSTYGIIDVNRHPELSLIYLNLSDSSSGDDDNRADAGETIEFYPMFRNLWGQADNIRFWIKVGFDNQGDWVWDDTTLIHALQDTAYFGKPLSSYAKATSLNPYRMTINPDCTDGRKINMTFFAICDNAADTLRQTITLDVENGVEIGGLITEDLTLYPNVHYIVTQNLGIPNGVTLTIKPGTILKFKDNVGIAVAQTGIIHAEGTADSMIVLSPADKSIGYWGVCTWNNNCLFKYTIFENYIIDDMRTAFYQCSMENCIIRNNQFPFLFQGYVTAKRLHVYDNILMTGVVLDDACTYVDCNFVNCNIQDVWSPLSRASLHGLNYDRARNCNMFNSYNIQAQSSIYLAEESSVPESIHFNYPSYYGTRREDILRKSVLDLNNGHGYGMFDLSNILTRPSAEAHGIVWKILVDGIDAQDEFELLPPIGVGTHRCDVYFNRPMDVNIAPIIGFGVRAPYTQHQVNENGSWSADSTIYTAYFTIDAKSVTDGLNTFKVYGAKDDEHFEIPEERMRFHMEVAATGSMSTGLMAEAGLGKVTLTWETDEEDFADLLGYNIYRWTHDTVKYNPHYDYNCYCYVEDWRFDTICINSSLIDSQDTAYIDYDVVPGKSYYYVIRQLTTSMSSYDISNPVTATPLTAIKGDANGSMSVDVADVITEVNYITRQNPQPFIFEAADVNSDNDVNIIDVVATVDLILHPQAGSQAVQENTAYYYIENGILYVETDVVLGGVQCTFEAEQGHTFTALSALNEFEKVGTWQSEEQYMFMAYSMSGKTLGVGKTALLQIGEAELTNIILSDAQGHNVATAPRISQALDGTTFVPAASKYLQEGALYIKHGKHIYNVMGTLIK